MDDLMTTLVRRADAGNWPPLLEDPSELRHRGAVRSRRRRRALVAGGTGLVVSAVVAGSLASSAWRADPPGPAATVRGGTTDPASDTDTGPNVVTISGVQVTLPDGWTTGYELVNDGGVQACVGPAPLPDSSCPMHVGVDRSATSENPHFLSTIECHPNGSASLTPTTLVWDGPPATVWARTCDSGTGPTADEYHLVDNTFSVAGADPPLNDEVQSIFESAVFPAGWPHDGQAGGSSASPR